MQRVKDFVRSVNLSSIGKRSIFLAISVVFMYLGIACYYQCGLGTDPYSVMVDGLHTFLNLSYGQVTNIINAVLFVLMLLFGRKYINIGTIINFVVAGVLIDAFNAALIALFPNLDLFGQTLMLIAGFLLFAAGTGIYIVAALGVGGVEFITLSFSEKTKINLRWVRIGFDVICMILGIVLGAIAGRGIFGDLIGVGTILGAFGTGVVMKFTIRLLDERLTKWFGPLRRKAEAF
ncbi:MAG: hypothetical protein V8T10_01350 [Merdibacter sp.]